MNSTQAPSGPSHTEIGNSPQPRLWNEAGAGDKAGDASDSDDLQRPAICTGGLCQPGPANQLPTIIQLGPLGKSPYPEDVGR